MLSLSCHYRKKASAAAYRPVAVPGSCPTPSALRASSWFSTGTSAATNAAEAGATPLVYEQILRRSLGFNPLGWKLGLHLLVERIVLNLDETFADYFRALQRK